MGLRHDIDLSLFPCTHVACPPPSCPYPCTHVACPPPSCPYPCTHVTCPPPACPYPCIHVACPPLQVRVGRAYGRVSRRLLRAHLLQMCLNSGVSYLDAEVVDVAVQEDGASSMLELKDGRQLRARWGGEAEGLGPAVGKP